MLLWRSVRIAMARTTTHFLNLYFKTSAGSYRCFSRLPFNSFCHCFQISQAVNLAIFAVYAAVLPCLLNAGGDGPLVLAAHDFHDAAVRCDVVS